MSDASDLRMNGFPSLRTGRGCKTTFQSLKSFFMMTQLVLNVIWAIVFVRSVKGAVTSEKLGMIFR